MGDLQGEDVLQTETSLDVSGEGGAVPGTRGLSVLQEQVQGEVRQPQPPSSRPLQKQERLRERTEEYIGVSLEL